MISTALFEEAEMSERSDRAFSKHWGWLWVLCDAAVEEEGGYSWLQLKCTDDERSMVLRSL